MKNLWMKQMTGNITVTITGQGAERFINKLVRDNISIWNVRRLSSEAVSFQMFISDVRHIREAVRYHRVKVKFSKKVGLPFFMKKLKRNVGFIIGCIIAIFTVLFLSNMIWNVEIKGASPEIEYKINNELKQLGVKKGQLQFFVDDPETLQRKITSKIDEITWIGVELKGTTYHFQVVEKKQPEKQEATSPQNLVAKKEAIIVDYFVESGKPLISVNDYVKPGQLLVSGTIGNEKQPNIVSAKGVVYGKTWYKTEATVDMKTDYSLLTGEEVTKRGLKIFNLDIPIWGFKKEDYKEKKIEHDEKEVKFLKWTLPISFTKTTIREAEVQEKTYSKEEAKEMAKELAKKDLQAMLPEDSKIVSEKILQEGTDNGKFKLTIIYTVVENIVKEQPIIHAN
ncbi:sporulation protein YqfD [Caldibacillus lycopersici]|uniref:Sporulation protein YqfD n=1 Tax=Perspicuibacillus lycopersici TaxID=1325689 RepID=A0AAE3IW27_9BACI|nr:sporulation protein YqfD [Perspicuibacillus lycopersici]MCU9613919.1 sporulation protein YqfD [Perspicuibacillus lycopersici]